MNTQILTSVAPELRASQLLSFDETKAELTALAKSSERITQITNKAGREECHSSLMLLKSRRVDIEKRGKEARDDANKFAKAVIAKERELIGFIAPEEERLQILRDQWDTAIEVARLAKLEAERLRVEAIQQKIQAIRDVPAGLVGKPSVIIAGQLAKLRETVLDEAELAEHYVTATDALAAAIARVEQLLAAQQEADAEKKRQAERDAEMEAMRVKMAEQQRLIDEAEEAKRAEQERLAQVERDRVAAEERAQREAEQARRAKIAELSFVPPITNWSCDRIDAFIAERRKLDPRDADNTFDFGELQGEACDKFDVTLGRLHEIRREAVRREHEEYEAAERRQQEQAALQAERERQAAEQRKLDEQAAQLKREREAAAAKAEADRLANLGLREAAQAVVEHFAPQLADGSAPTSVKDLRAALANDENSTAVARTVNRTKRAARA